MSADLLFQIALTNVPTVGAVQAKILVAHFGNAEDIFKASQKELERIEGIGEIKAKCIKSFDDFTDAEEEIKFVEKYKIQPLFLTHNGYPKRLLACYDSPTLLYYRGNADLNASKIISIIGTRNNTDYGKQLTEQLIHELQTQQVLIVSGLAYGVDAIAHKAAVNNNMATIGVLAHGLDSIYPPAHASLAKQMLLNGGLLTELTRKLRPTGTTFPNVTELSPEWLMLQ
jgi:DNA processing protein